MKTLQQRLKAKGFNPGAIDGIDGPLDIYRVVSPQASGSSVSRGLPLKSQSRGRARLKRRRTYDFI
jgi:peptidoglycan hydrolase-like protein with peptidoglycan-binding domain